MLWATVESIACAQDWLRAPEIFISQTPAQHAYGDKVSLVPMLLAPIGLPQIQPIEGTVYCT